LGEEKFSQEREAINENDGISYYEYKSEIQLSESHYVYQEKIHYIYMNKERT
jgi:hypothetical protein